MLVFPVRHHSPAAALQLERLIRDSRPEVVLVEGPSDATDLIPLLLDTATIPPVALYAYRTGEDVRASYYPFCHYSPEYAALRAGHEIGAELHFCDVPAATALSWYDDEKHAGPIDAEPDAVDFHPAGQPDYADFATAVSEAAGFPSFEPFWEAAFEQAAARRDVGGYVELMLEFGKRTRELSNPGRNTRDAVRERHMATVARAVLARGAREDSMVLVCGAAHAEAVSRIFDSGEDTSPLEPAPAVEITLIPYSFLRLSEQVGYGAGNRAPWFYHQVWDLQGDFAAATRRTLVALAQHLRQDGHVASLAQSIDAYNLARVLAGMRGKLAPGVDEVVDAAEACFGQGHSVAVAHVLRRVLVGEAVGGITHRVGRTPLQVEFYASAGRLGLPIMDAPRQVLIHMATAAEAEQSVFLHRLTVADIPYGRELESGLGGRGRAAQGGPLDQLARVREKWELQWTPAADAKLIERTAWGSTLVEVCGRLLGEELTIAQRVDAGTAVLLKLALCDIAGSFAAALGRCESLAADSSSFPALARATYHLDGLLTYGSARRLPVEQLSLLAERLFVRAALHLPAAANCGDDDALKVQETLTALYELVQRDSPVASDRGGFWQAVEMVSTATQSHPALRGLALLLLALDGRLGPDALAARLRFWLSATSEAADNARLVAGLFSLHRGTLVRNQGLVAAVTDFLLELDLDQLTPLLPVLRRSLGNLSAGERSYLAETLAGVLGLEDTQARQELRVASTEQAWLREIDTAAAATLASWKDRYGIA